MTTDGCSGNVRSTVSAGETGAAADASEPATEPDGSEVVVGEIPDATDLTRMLWTARCTYSRHGLLGTYPDQEAAEAARQQHLLVEHSPGNSV
jgi:hypothetical protein